jgi:hypothetical protein
MGLVDHEGKFEVNYSKADVLKALKTCLGKLDGFSVERVDDKIGSISIKAGLSLWSWGENITLSLSETPNGNTQVSILSTPKTGIALGGALDMGKNRKNIGAIMRSLSQELNNYQPTLAGSALNSKEDIYNRIRELNKLKVEGIITEEDFEMKKRELLDQV